MTASQRKARIAGLLYLSVVFTGLFSLMYVPAKLIVSDNASQTYLNIASSDFLFRCWIVGGLLCYTFFLFLPLALYKLLKHINENYAILMVLFAILSVPVFFLNTQNLLTIHSLVSGANNPLGLSTEQIQLQVMLFLKQYNNGLTIVHIFSGLWLYPFGYLVFKSGYLPKFLGILLILGCFGYLINFLGNTLLSNYSKVGISFYVQLPASIGEIGTCLWLLVMGAKNRTTSNIHF